MKLTTNIKLNPISEQIVFLQDTTKFYIETVNNLLAGFNNGNTMRITSKDVKVNLPSCLKNSCINDAKSVYHKYLKDLKKDSEKKLPVLKKEVSIWNNQNYKINFEGKYITFPVFFDGKTTRIKVDAYLINKEILKTNKLGTMRILTKNNKWYAQISYEMKELYNEDAINIMGVDLGLKVPAVCVTGSGTTKFFGNGRKNKYLRRIAYVKKQQLGKAKKLKAIKNIKDKEKRVMTDIDHKISRNIINLAIKDKVEIIRLEKLTNIRKTTRTSRKNEKHLHTWSFYRLSKFIEYKANLLGIKVEYVDPSNTSKMCPFCGTLNKTTTRTYKCNCGYRGHRDRVGALNILNTYNVPLLCGNSITA